MDGHAPSFRTKLVSELLRRVPANVRGRTRLARAALGSGLRARNVQLATRDGDFVVPNLDGPTAFHLLVDGVYESEEIDLVLSRLPRGGTFADVGANIGVYSVPAAKKVGPDGRVLLFEASPRIQEYLAHNLELNRVKNATVLKFAVGDVDGGSVAFYDSPSENFGMGTLTNLFGTEPIHVPLFSLDYLLADAGVAHIDVMKVGRGARGRGVPRCGQATYGARAAADRLRIQRLVGGEGAWCNRRRRPASSSRLRLRAPHAQRLSRRRQATWRDPHHRLSFVGRYSAQFGFCVAGASCAPWRAQVLPHRTVRVA